MQIHAVVQQHGHFCVGRLYAVHFNDSKNACGSHKNRHEKLGQGQLGLEVMKRIAMHPALKGRPFILETPNDDAGYIDVRRLFLYSSPIDR